MFMSERRIPSRRCIPSPGGGACGRHRLVPSVGTFSDAGRFFFEMPMRSRPTRSRRIGAGSKQCRWILADEDAGADALDVRRAD